MTDAARDKYLRRKYGIGLADYQRMLAEHGGGCWICGSKPVTRALAVDHTHKFKYFKVETVRTLDDRWYASTPQLSGVNAEAKRKNDAIRACRQQAKRRSVRGLLCFPCNGMLRKAKDNAEILASASEYLRRHAEEAQWRNTSSS